MKTRRIGQCYNPTVRITIAYERSNGIVCRWRVQMRHCDEIIHLAWQPSRIRALAHARRIREAIRKLNL